MLTPAVVLLVILVLVVRPTSMNALPTLVETAVSAMI
jgi:hypothetical protein